MRVCWKYPQIVRTKLESMAPAGDCRFVELLEVKPKKKKKGKGKGKDKAKVVPNQGSKQGPTQTHL